MDAPMPRGYSNRPRNVEGREATALDDGEACRSHPLRSSRRVHARPASDARHILVPTVDECNTVLVLVAKGETSFASLVSQYSTCPSKSRGGSLGSFGPGTMVKEFGEVVFALDTKVGEIKGPVKTQFGYHLLVVDKRSGGSDWY